MGRPTGDEDIPIGSGESLAGQARHGRFIAGRTVRHGLRRMQNCALVALLTSGCNLDTFGMGGGSVELGGDETSTGSAMPTSAQTGDTAAGDGDGDGATTVPPPPGDTTASSDPGSTSSENGTTGDGTTTGGEMCPMECPLHWVCEFPDCVNPDEGDPCGNPGDCGPAAPQCGPDGMCHDGSEDDPCFDDAQCAGPLLCNPNDLCHSGDEGDPCAGPDDCNGTAPLCSGGTCHDGGKGDPCSDDAQCDMLLCNPNGMCQDGDEGDPCAGSEDCGAGAPHCAHDDECHDGSIGDPCSGNVQCGAFLFCVLGYCI